MSYRTPTIALALVVSASVAVAAAKARAQSRSTSSMSPGATSAHQKNGRFPDRSVLVKEVFEATTGAMTTRTVTHA